MPNKYSYKKAELDITQYRALLRAAEEISGLIKTPQAKWELDWRVERGRKSAAKAELLMRLVKTRSAR